MKTLTLKTVAVISGLVALTSLAVLPAYADTPKDESLGASTFESAKSRDEVLQEFIQASNNGGSTAYDVDAPVLANAAPSAVLRDDVYAETIEWMRTQGTDIGMGE